MTTRIPTTDLPTIQRPTGIESVKFSDGMIVTADDLDAAQRYPASLLHTVLRSHFGCGVLCGLELEVRDAPGKRPNWVVRVDQGVAIDCAGYPLELCAPIEINLAPDECDCEPPPPQVCIAIKRATSDEAAPDVCGCDLDGPHFDCRRVRDHVEVKAFSRAEFDALPVTCRRPEPADGTGQGDDCGPSTEPGSEPLSPCQCLTACPDEVCGESWILLGCVDIYEDDHELEGVIGDADTSQRRWVKPIECLCGPANPSVDDLTDQAITLEATVDELTERVATLEAIVDQLTRPEATEAASAD
jgi:hypothetical protein